MKAEPWAIRPPRARRSTFEYLEKRPLGQDLRRRAVQGAGFTVLAQFGNYAIDFCAVVVLSRLLTPADFGIVSMVTVFSMLLQNFGVNGFTEVIIQKDDLSHEQLSTFFWVNVGLSGSIMALFMALSPLIGWFYGEPRLKPVTIALGMSIILGGLSTHHMALLKRNLLFLRAAIIDVIAVVGSVAIAITLARRGAGYWALVVRRVSIPALTVPLAWLMCSWRPSLPSRSASVGSMIRFAMQTYGNYCLTYFNRSFDKILVGRFLGPSALGNYDRAYQFTGMLPNQVTIPLTNVANATLSRLRGDPAKFRRYFYYVFGIIAFIGMLASSVMTVVGRDAMLVLLGGQWEQAGVIFTAFAPGIGMMLLYSMHQWLHFSLGRADRLLRWGAIALGVMVVVYIVGLPFGPLGMAVAATCSSYALLWPAIGYAGKPIGVTASACFREVWRYLVAAAASTACVIGLTCLPSVPMHVYASQTPIVRVVLSGLAVTIVYSAFVAALFRGVRPFARLIGLVKEMGASGRSAPQ